MDKEDFKFFAIIIPFTVISIYFFLKMPKEYIYISSVVCFIINFVANLFVNKVIEEKYI